jgi:uncharacterized protein YbjQ (UPF0145 family)
MPTEYRIPQSLVPERAERVEVPIDAVTGHRFDAEHVGQVVKQLGTVLVEASQFRALAELGVQAKALGIVQTIHGSFVLGRGAIHQAMEMLGKIVNEGTGAYSEKVKMDAAKSIGYLVGQLTKVNVSEVKVEETVAAVQMGADKLKRRSFQPGMKVVIDVPDVPN